MKINQEIFAIKLYEMDQEYAKLQSRIRLCGQEGHSKIRQELQRIKDEYVEQNLIVRQRAEGSRSPAVAELAQIQLEYYWKMNCTQKEAVRQKIKQKRLACTPNTP